ncbi:MAG: ATP-binding protein [Spirulinaceae cyanobacterium]
METTQILIVEDELLIAKGLARKLKKLGYTVMNIVTSGQAALDLISQQQPDVVLMDIAIQGDIDGIETAGKIAESYNLPVIYVTAYADDSTLERAGLTGSYGYILKPYKEREVHAAIQIALKKHKQAIALQESLQKAQHQNADRSRYLSIASHDLRTPLTAIQMSAEILEHHGEKIAKEKQIKHVKRIQASIHNMNELLEDLLIVSRAELGKLEFNPIPTPALAFFTQIFEEFQTVVTPKHNFVFTPQNLPPEMTIDPKLLRHILTNLLSNAIKYSPQGGKIEFIVCYCDNQIIITIKDWGIGFPASYQNSLFKEFERAQNVGKIKGTGLGLSIVKQAVDLHGGAIALDSQEAIGTTATVTLPLK